MNENDLPPAAPAEAPAPASRAAATESPGWERSTMERLLFATLEEQKTARRWRAFVRLAWLAFFIFLIWALTFRNAPSDKMQPHTAVIQIEGEIGPKTEASAEAIIAAWNGRKPGGIRRGFGYAVVGRCRRAVYADGSARMYGNTDIPDFRAQGWAG